MVEERAGTMSALEGTTVIDFSRDLAGAMCTLQLADAGAEVIKVEPLSGDPIRQLGPMVNGQSNLFLMLNRDKHSIAMDYTDPAVHSLVLALVRQADVVVTDFAPSYAETIQCTYEQFRAARPDVIHCSITPYGETGPYADLPATELEMQGISACMWFMGQLGEPPVRVGADIVTDLGAMQAFVGIVAALFRRHTSGEGQHVSVSLMGSILSHDSHWMADFSDPDEYGGGMTAPYDAPETGYATADRSVMLNFPGRFAERQAYFLEFCKAVGLSELLEDEWMAKYGAGYVGVGTDAQLMRPLLEERLRTMSSDEVARIMLQKGGVGIPYADYSDMYGDPPHPQVEAARVIREVSQPDGDPYKIILSPWAMYGDVGRVDHTPAPSLGAHTDQVFGDLGYYEAALRSLREAGKVL